MSNAGINQVWKALSDPNRRAMIDLLRERPRTTGDLCVKFRRLSRFAVMKHLRVLEQTQLVKIKRDGRFRWNYLNPDPILEIDRRWFRHYRRQSLH